MKSLFQFILLLLCTFRLSAQNASNTPVFLLFTQDCMDQLEYRYTYSGAGVLTYSVHPNSNEQFLLKAGNEGITSPTLPKGAVTCRGFTMNSAFTDAINQQKRQVYVVHQTPSGYLQMPIIEAIQVTRNGVFYLFKAPNYSFALDSTKLVGSVNLGTANSGSYVYLSGVKARECRREYSFRREPVQTGMERADFDFIPGIGITSDRSGVTASEAEGNTRRLVKMNGMAFDDYLVATCKGTSVPPSTLPQYAPEFGYGTANPNPNTVTEPNKEDYSATTPTTPAGPPPGLISCPEMPGYGYHIVQPKETLAAIARTYNVDIKKIQKWNNIENANHIEICQKVWVTQPPKTTVAKGVTATKPKAPTGATVNSQKMYWNQPGAPAAYATPTTGATVTYLPAQYNTTGNPYYFTQPQPLTTAAPTATRPAIHVVQKGESVYSISKHYACAEECIRRANGMPLEGNVALQINQQIIIPECTCQVPASTGNVSNPSMLNKLAGGNVLNPAGTSNPVAPTTYSTPGNPDPIYINNPTEPFSETSVLNNNNNLIPKGNTTTQPQTGTAAYFQEYVVKQGDTLGSIAAKFKVSSAELVQVNSLEANETLMPGKRLLIPRTN
ncbi:MAG: LysM peptidoglycan-binding domain-containing protein [Bacteroidetes bacterium]|nr:LysM peptidoglycan-binding domain-containing protein [Bacteroidota bacterium]